jgi:hypothetical protein
MTSPEIKDEMRFADVMEQADNTLKRALGKAGEKLASYIEAQPKQEKEPCAEDAAATLDKELQRAFRLILEGDYFKIERDHLKPLVERLTPFIEYAENQDELTAEQLSN